MLASTHVSAYYRVALCGGVAYIYWCVHSEVDGRSCET